MSLGGDKNPNNLHDLITTICIGIAIIVFGISSSTDRLYFSYVHGIVDLGKYHGAIGLGAIVLGIIYLFLAIKNFLEDA